MADSILWTLAPGRAYRRAVGHPNFNYDFVPPGTATSDRLLEMWATSEAIAGGGTYDRLLEMWATAAAIVTPPDPGFTRPTGPGIYAIEDLSLGGDWATMPGAGGFIAAMNNVATLAAAPDGTRHLTLPDHVFTAPSFAQSAAPGYLGFLCPRNVGVIGSGNGTIFEVAENGMTPAQSTAYERYGLSYNNVNLMYVFLTQNCPAGTIFGQFKIRGTRQYFKGNQTSDVLREHYYGGWNVQQSTSALTINDVTITGIPGYLNTPPGETFSINMNSTSNVKINRMEIDGRRESDNVRVAAALFGTNSAANLELRDCYFHHAFCSHGFATWQTRNVTTYNTISEFNGTGSGGAFAGTAGDGLNQERSFNIIHYSPKIGNNSLCEVRYYAENKGDSYDGNTTGHQLVDLTLTEGALNIRLDNGQSETGGAITLTRCPTPVYTRT